MSRQPLGKLGVWAFVDHLSAPDAVAFARQVEAWGYPALWLPEAVGRDPFAVIAHLAAHTETLVFANGIANIYARDAMAMNAAHKSIAEMAPGRFVLGLGVSHAPMVTDLRGHDYGKPVSTMRAYLERMQKSMYFAPQPEHEAPIVLAALRSKMLQLAAEQTAGCHPYFVPPEHTARARQILGAKPWLCPEQMIMLESDPAKARAAARKQMGVYVALPNYRNNLLELGFATEDFEEGGSDKLVDAIVAWGDERAIRERLQAHWDAGADHVCVQALRNDGEAGVDTELLALLAPNSD